MECNAATGYNYKVKHHELVEALAVPHTATSAYRTLLDLGMSVLPAVRAGLRHNNPDVRFHCCRFLETLSDLLDWEGATALQQK